MLLRACAMALLFAIATSATARDYSVISIVGDSVSEGWNPDYSRSHATTGWVHRLTGQAGPPYSWNITNLWAGAVVYNHAVGGSEASEWADTNAFPYLTYVLADCPDLAIVMIGANDFFGYAADGAVTADEVAAYEANLRSIIHALQSITPAPDILVLGYYDMFDGLSQNLPLFFSAYRMASAATLAGNQLIEEIALAHGCFFVCMQSCFMHHCYGCYLGDAVHVSPHYVLVTGNPADVDVHPVTAGHNAICEAVYGALGELKDIPRIRRFERCGDKAVIDWSSAMGQKYVIERTPDLARGPFLPIATNFGFPPMNTYTAAVGTAGALFYRLRPSR
jgi:lysophospholipase L1-like esterase